jgi:hypothetical protein
MYQSYVYKITNKITNQFYYGSRTNNVKQNRHPEDDLWKHYFTSSSRIKEMIEEYGIDSFEYEILSKYDDYKDCFWEEQRLIFESKENKLRINKTYVDPVTGKKVLTTYNESLEEKQKRADKISKAKKGKFNSNGHFGLKHTEETKIKMRESQARLGYTHSDETKEKMKKYKRTAEHATKLGESLRGNPWSDARRQSYLKRKEKNGSPL